MIGEEEESQIECSKPHCASKKHSSQEQVKEPRQSKGTVSSRLKPNPKASGGSNETDKARVEQYEPELQRIGGIEKDQCRRKQRAGD